MTFSAVLVSSLLRATAAALVAVPVSAWQETVFRRLTASRRWWSAVAFAPLLAPDLLVGYAYARFDLSLLHRPVWNECFYFALMVLKTAPAGLVLRLLAPPPLLSRESLHCFRLLRPSESVGRPVRIRLRYMLSSVGMTAGLLVFILVFQDFELASEMSIAAWTVHLFDSQARGLNPPLLLQRALVPAAVQLAATGLFVRNLLRTGWNLLPRWREHHVQGTTVPGLVGGAVSSLLGCGLLWVLPFAIVSGSGLPAARAVTDNPVLMRSFGPELAVAVIVAACAGAGAAGICVWLARRLQSGIDGRQVGSSSLSGKLKMLTLCLAGVLVGAGSVGSLVLSAFVLVAIQWPGVVLLRGTVLPLVTTLVLSLIPRGLFLFLVVAPAFRRESAHLTGLLASGGNEYRSLRASMRLWSAGPRRALLLTALLAWWAFLNLTATAMLCPPSISLPGTSGAVVPLPVRLYNLMHYGRSGPLSLMALLSVVCPLLLLFVLERTAGWCWRRRRISRLAARTG